MNESVVYAGFNDTHAELDKYVDRQDQDGRTFTLAERVRIKIAKDEKKSDWMKSIVRINIAYIRSEPYWKFFDSSGKFTMAKAKYLDEAIDQAMRDSNAT